jgi:CheY-like chemotaxis protein
MAAAHRPDLILLDIHLPDMEGDAVLRALRVNPDLEATPVVMLTADLSPELADRMRAAGAQDYLVKPLDFERFFTVLDTHLPR